MPKSLTLLRGACVVSALLVSSPAFASNIFASAANFEVLAGTTITNTGSTSVFGNLGVAPGSAITGIGTITFEGASTTDANDAAAQQAQLDEAAAYNTLAALPFTTDLTGHDLGTSGTSPLATLTPGVYNFDTSAQLNGTLTLDAQGLSNAMFVFEIGSTLTTASAANVAVINGNSTDGIYWLVGSSATLGTGTTFAGNILAVTSITLTTGAQNLCGRVFAQTGAVTMDANALSNDCASFDDSSGRSDFSSVGFSGDAQAAPEPGTFGVLAATIGIFALFLKTKRIRLRA